MSLYEFIPVEKEGMSVITALIFFFASLGALALINWVKDRLNTHDEILEKHDKTFEQVKDELIKNRIQYTKMEGTIEKTQIIVDRIDKSLSDIARTNTKVIENYLSKGKQ